MKLIAFLLSLALISPHGGVLGIKAIRGTKGNLQEPQNPKRPVADLLAKLHTVSAALDGDSSPPAQTFNSVAQTMDKGQLVSLLQSLRKQVVQLSSGSKLPSFGPPPLPDAPRESARELLQHHDDAQDMARSLQALLDRVAPPARPAPTTYRADTAAPRGSGESAFSASYRASERQELLASALAHLRRSNDDVRDELDEALHRLPRSNAEILAALEHLKQGSDSLKEDVAAVGDKASSLRTALVNRLEELKEGNIAIAAVLGSVPVDDQNILASLRELKRTTSGLKQSFESVLDGDDTSNVGQALRAARDRKRMTAAMEGVQQKETHIDTELATLADRLATLVPDLKKQSSELLAHQQASSDEQQTALLQQVLEQMQQSAAAQQEEQARAAKARQAEAAALKELGQRVQALETEVRTAAGEHAQHIEDSKQHMAAAHQHHAAHHAHAADAAAHHRAHSHADANADANADADADADAAAATEKEAKGATSAAMKHHIYPPLPTTDADADADSADDSASDSDAAEAGASATPLAHPPRKAATPAADKLASLTKALHAAAAAAGPGVDADADEEEEEEGEETGALQAVDGFAAVDPATNLLPVPDDAPAERVVPATVDALHFKDQHGRVKTTGPGATEAAAGSGPGAAGAEAAPKAPTAGESESPTPPTQSTSAGDEAGSTAGSAAAGGAAPADSEPEESLLQLQDSTDKLLNEVGTFLKH